MKIKVNYTTSDGKVFGDLAAAEEHQVSLGPLAGLSFEYPLTPDLEKLRLWIDDNAGVLQEYFNRKTVPARPISATHYGVRGDGQGVFLRRSPSFPGWDYFTSSNGPKWEHMKVPDLERLLTVEALK